MKTEPILDQDWYYSIEVEPGVFTKGKDHPNIAITRKLLGNIAVKDMDCIDIGTQEGMVPLLLKRRGARRVVGYDQVSVSDRIEFVQKHCGARFDYLAGFQLPELPLRLDQCGGRFFDLVVFSGVLYHTINPFGLLALVRGLCKVGGLFVLETKARQHPQECLFFNARGPTRKPDLRPGQQTPAYFTPATAWLDYVLRMLALQPLHALYIGSLDAEKSARVAILCKSVAEPLPLDASDAWMKFEAHREQFEREAQIDWYGLGEARSTIQFSPYDSSVQELGNRGLFKALATCPPFAYTNRDLKLPLSAEI